MNMRVSETEKGVKFVSAGSADIHGREVKYDVISEETLLDGVDGTIKASMFSYSYLLRGASDAARRPVMFVYNGGPGSSSHLMHVGFFGTERAKIYTGGAPVAPPYETESNPHCLLDICDIVLVDPVDTGFARMIAPEAAGEFFGVEQDAQAMAVFIENWLDRYGRRNSPVYLCGESYGTMRSAVLVNTLMGGVAPRRFTGIAVNGVIMMGSTFHLEGEPMYVEPSVLNLMSYAAAHRYHHGVDVPLERFAEEAWEFAVGGYAHVLLLGDYLSAAERKSAIERLAFFTGMDADYFRRNGLRLEKGDFLTHFLAGQGLEAGGYDSRVTLPLSNSTGSRDSFDDPSLAASTPMYTALFRSHFAKRLGISLDREYIATNIESNMRWNWECSRTPLQCLSASMRRNPELRVMFASGLYDLCTPAGYARYVIAHDGLPLDRIVRREYEGGHMIYTNESAAAALERDIRAFISVE